MFRLVGRRAACAVSAGIALRCHTTRPTNDVSLTTPVAYSLTARFFFTAARARSAKRGTATLICLSVCLFVRPFVRPSAYNVDVSCT